MERPQHRCTVCIVIRYSLAFALGVVAGIAWATVS